jgi:hypothetical protein
LRPEVIEVLTAQSWPPLDQIEIVGKESDYRCSQSHVAETCRSLTVDQHLSPTRYRYLNRYVEAPRYIFEAPADHRTLLPRQNQGGVRCPPERLLQGQVSDRFENVGLPGTVATDEDIDARIGIEAQLPIAAKVVQLQPSKMHGTP